MCVSFYLELRVKAGPSDKLGQSRSFWHEFVLRGLRPLSAPPENPQID